MNPIVLACIAASLVLLYKIVQLLLDARKPPPPEAKWQIGDITLHSLRFHNGMDYSKPVLIAIKGVVYDVTNSMGEKYGPGKLPGAPPGAPSPAGACTAAAGRKRQLVGVCKDRGSTSPCKRAQ
jgi:hypothetical protein